MLFLDRFRLFLLLALFPAVFLPSFGAEAAEDAGPPADETTEAPPVEEAPETLAVAGVPAREAQLTNELKKMLSRLEQSGGVLERGESNLADLKRGVDRVERRLQFLGHRSAGARRLNSVEEALNEVNETGRQLQSRLEGYAEDLNADAEKLQEADELWERTKQTAVEEGAPADLLTEIETLQALLAETREAYAKQLNSTLSLESQIAAEIGRAASLERDLEEMQRALAAGLLRPDSPPLWQVGESLGGSENFREEWNHFHTESIESLHLVWKSKGALLRGIGLLFLVTIPIFLVIRHKHEALLAKDQRLSSAVSLIQRPVSTAILLNALLVILLIPTAPQIVILILFLVSIVPLLRLIAPFVGAPQHAYAYAIVGLTFLANHLAYVLPEGAAVSRLIALFCALTTVVLGLRFVRANRQIKSRSTFFYRWGAWLAVVVAGIALALNIFGFAVLSAVLFEDVIRTAFEALATLISIRVVRALLRLQLIASPMRHMRSVSLHFLIIDRNLGRLLYWVGIVVWLRSALGNFGFYEPLYDSVEKLLSAEASFGALSISLGSIVLFFLSVWAATIISRVLRFFLETDVYSRLSLGRGMPATISMLVHYGMITLGFFLALAVAGIDFSQLGILVGALGVGIGFGLQNLVNNFVSGLILIFERPITVGDVIEFGSNAGEVRAIGIRSIPCAASTGPKSSCPTAA